MYYVICVTPSKIYYIWCVILAKRILIAVHPGNNIYTFRYDYKPYNTQNRGQRRNNDFIRIIACRHTTITPMLSHIKLRVYRRLHYHPNKKPRLYGVHSANLFNDWNPFQSNPILFLPSFFKSPLKVEPSSTVNFQIFYSWKKTQPFFININKRVLQFCMFLSIDSPNNLLLFIAFIRIHT